jgi:hypothetical protein
MPDDIPDNLPDSRPFYSTELLIARAQTTQRRAGAMCMDYDIVAGLQLRAMTPASYSRLTVIGSPFTYRGEASTGDVRNYVWLHSPEFTACPQRAEKARAAVLARLDRNIAPAWQRWRYSRRARHTLIAAGYAIAAAKIAELCEVAFADAPPPGGKGPTVGASLEAQFIDTFASAYHRWPLATSVSDTPLRKLYQLLRCINGGDFDAEEADIIAADLKAENEALAAARASAVQAN